MKISYIFFLFLFVGENIFAQQIEVLNVITEEPIRGVTIYNFDKSINVISDENGIANLDLFSNNETLYFQHLTHILKIIKKPDIGKSNIIYLDANTQGLDEIVISASKFEQDKKDIPQKIISLNHESIAFVTPQTSADLLEETGHVYIQKSHMGGGSPIIRGLSTNRLLITIDGVRMNNAIFRGGNLHNVISIDPFSIQSTEVTLGSNSVIYGSDAIGGVMSFYTQKPQLSYSDSLLFKSNTIVRYATANDEKTGHIDLNFGYKKWGVLTNFSYTSFGDLIMGRNGPKDYLRPEFVLPTDDGDLVINNKNPLIQKFSGYNQINLMQKLRFEPYKKLSFDFGLYYTKTSDVPRYDRLIQYKGDKLKSAEWNYGPQKWFMTNIQVTKLSSRSILYDKIKTTLAYQNFQESRKNRDFQSNFRNIREEDVRAYSSNLDCEKKITNKTLLFYGLEYVYNKVMSKGKVENINNGSIAPNVSRYPNGASWESAAAYTSIKYKPNLKFVFQSGLRFNHIVSKSDFTENNFFLNLPFKNSKNSAGALTGTAGISWSPSEILQWKLNTSSAFRAPNIDDIGKVFDSEPGSVVVPNQNLKPEYAYGAELGLKLNFNNTFVLDLSNYYTHLDNALVRKNYSLNGETNILYDGEQSNVQAIQNSSKAWIYGFEVGLKWSISNTLKLISQYNIINGKEESDKGIELPIRHVVPYFGNTHLVWDNKKLKVDFFINYNNELSNNQLAPSEIEKAHLYALNKNGNPFAPAWHTLNFRTQYKINNTTSITTSLENITDIRYKTYSSGIAAAGRNFILSLKYSL